MPFRVQPEVLRAMADLHDESTAPRSTYWRSLRELHDAGAVDEAKAHEFMAGVTDDFALEGLPAISRKKFLALLTASAAFAAAGCSNYRDKGEIVPYTKKPEEVIPGVANFYASTCTGCAQRCGMLVKTREGRPIKLDGNPDHPVNSGALCARGQAGILGLYDPARLKSPLRGSASGPSGETTWIAAETEITAQLHACREQGKEIAIVTAPILSPSARAVLTEWMAAFPPSRLYVYDMFPEETRRSAWEKAFGSPALPPLAWERAAVIVSLDADFLGVEGNTVEATRRFAAGRNAVAGGTTTRLYAIEGTMSLTGANADYRLRLSPDAQGELVLGLLHEIGVVQGAGAIDPAALQAIGGTTLSSVATRHGLSPDLLQRMAGDLMEHRGSGIVLAGAVLPEPVHVAVHYLNDILGNTALYDQSAAAPQGFSAATQQEMETLVAGMRNGRVGMVIHLGTNPVYQLPRGFGYAEALHAVPFALSFAEAEDETGALCRFVLPVHTMFESWGDHQVRPGILSLQQPVIAPLYDSRQWEGVLLSWARQGTPYQEGLYRDFIKQRWEREVYPASGSIAGAAPFWKASLHDGVITLATSGAATARFNTAALALLGGIRQAGKGWTLLLRPNHFVGDGSYANNGWLQELPHPISKIVWDNYAALSPGTAKTLGVRTSDLIEVRTKHGRQTLPVFVQPGQADRCVSVELGYGRWKAGPIGAGVGTDACMLLPVAGLTGSRVVDDVQVTVVPGTYELVSTQEHHALDDTFLKDLHLKREIIREGTVAGYAADPAFLQHHRPELFSISAEVPYNGLKWAMAIDLNKCTGCNACVSGCNVENNIPVVGKDQVRAGREMQWIRIDRYYAGEPDDPRLSHQPMLCQHCDQAPCENVCPVSATTHSPDGLNQMTYNRCVGTKYCSNNCPYKVRRFNFYDFRGRLADGYYDAETVGLMHNPEVTVRSRGVMEKCTFCVQRIMEARQHAAEEGRAVNGNDVRTACQQACPAQAITFGDMNDPASDVARHRKHQLGYHVIEEVNARPNVTYMARLRNTHPEKLS
jgi:Fe-S-cluster-containing dehydrogenase component/anaerobic selenocysteine-containing dehydrogenase